MERVRSNDLIFYESCLPTQHSRKKRVVTVLSCVNQHGSIFFLVIFRTLVKTDKPYSVCLAYRHNK